MGVFRIQWDRAQLRAKQSSDQQQAWATAAAAADSAVLYGAKPSY